MISTEEKEFIIQRLLQENEFLKTKINELEKRLGLNSKNSSKPPSSDDLQKPPRTNGLREKGKHKSGGQNGQEGTTLKQVANPNKIVQHQINQCPHCHNTLNNKVNSIIKRQVY